MFKLAERRGGQDGLYCGRDGVYLGSAALIERREGRYWPRAEDEVAALLAAACETPIDVARFLAGLREVAMALEEGDLGRAMIATLQLRLQEMPEPAIARIAHADASLKYNFNPLQPRDWHGRWGGDGSDGALVPPAPMDHHCVGPLPTGKRGSARATPISATVLPPPKVTLTSRTSATAR